MAHQQPFAIATMTPRQLANHGQSFTTLVANNTNSLTSNNNLITGNNEPSTSAINQLGCSSQATSNSATHAPRLRQKATRSRTGANNKRNPTTTKTNHYVCSGCNKVILKDKFLLKACNKYWHENCLKCDRCKCRLGEIGSTLYDKSNFILCRQDYIDMFGKTGICSRCDKLIPAIELVMKAKNNVYHLECFSCQLCNQRFCVGDRFYLCDNKIVCQYDYDEHYAHLMDINLSEQPIPDDSNEDNNHETIIHLEVQSMANDNLNPDNNNTNHDHHHLNHRRSYEPDAGQQPSNHISSTIFSSASQAMATTNELLHLHRDNGEISGNLDDETFGSHLNHQHNNIKKEEDRKQQQNFVSYNDNSNQATSNSGQFNCNPITSYCSSETPTSTAANTTCTTINESSAMSSQSGVLEATISGNDIGEIDCGQSASPIKSSSHQDEQQKEVSETAQTNQQTKE